MNKLIENFALESGLIYPVPPATAEPLPHYISAIEKFTKLVVSKTLDEVASRAFVSGDRAWSDDEDRAWVELEFGIGKLAELKK